MPNYKANDFWEKSHLGVASENVNRGFGVRHVGGGESDVEAAALYRLREINANRVLRKCSISSHPKIFELGSGGGFWVDFFHRLNPALFFGSDLSPTAVARLRSNYPDDKFVSVADDEAWLQIKQAGPYDLCLGIDVLYHIVDDAIWERALKNLCSNCKAGGWLLLADYFFEQPRELPSISHVKHRSMQTYLNILDEQQFRVVHIQPIFYFLNRIVSGPWKDHNGLTTLILRWLSGNRIGLIALVAADSLITRLTRPMTPVSKTRFLLAQKRDDAYQSGT